MTTVGGGFARTGQSVEARWSAIGVKDDAIDTTRTGEPVPTLFVIQDGRSSSWELAAVSHLDERIAVRQVRIDRTRAGTLRTLQALAARLLPAIRHLQPHGPYRFAGWGLGGVVAYELSIQLMGEDEEVDFVGALGLRDTSDCYGDYDVLPSPLIVHAFPGSENEEDLLCGWVKTLPATQVRTVRRKAGADAELKSESECLVHAFSQAVHHETTDWASEIAAPYRSLFTIQGGDGKSAPLFCVPGAGAGATEFVGLAMELGGQRALHGFQARGLGDDQLVPYSSVKAAARAYVAELEKIAPRGGVHLLGHSFGGWVAFEMALLLQSTGRLVLSLAVLDSSPPAEHEQPGPEFTACEALMELVSLYGQAGKGALDVSRRDIEGRDRESRLALLHMHLVRRGIMPMCSTYDSLRGPVRAFEVALRTNYHPAGTVHAPVKLMVVPGAGEHEESARTRLQAEAAAWHRFAPNLKAKLGWGTHLTMLRRPHCSLLATWLRNDVLT